MWAVHHVVAMKPSRGLTSSLRRLAAERDLDAVEQPAEPAVGLERAPPVSGQRADRIDGHDPHPPAALGTVALRG